jgi:ribosomal protein L11 methyltransferase
MDYTEVQFSYSCNTPDHEFLISKLVEIGYESFMEEENRLFAYIPESDFREDLLKQLQENQTPPWKYTVKQIREKNWNENWESNFNPVSISPECIIRAPFHKQSLHIKYDLIIEPKMSFGTGHHETTHMMLEFILNGQMKNKILLDMGCGTGVLSILGAKMGAKSIDAVDNDQWAYENCKSNLILNQVENIEVSLGDASGLKKNTYDIIFANINRNILLRDIPLYANAGKENSMLFISGFYSNDFDIIQDKAMESGFSFIEKRTMNNWVAAKYINRNG